MSLNIMMPHAGSSASDIQAYLSKAGRYDEMVSPDGQIRSHWQTFLNNFSLITPPDQKLLSEKLDRLVFENGLAHDVFADPDLLPRNWRIDLMPIMLSLQDWQWLSAAVSQRARLFNQILKDIYGAQRFLKDGTIPARMIFSDSSFLKPCVRTEQDFDPLFFFAIDVARNGDGSWRVIDCHSETPAGLGFAVANRVVHTKVLGEIFETCKIQREAAYFQNVLTNIPLHIGQNSSNIVVLSHGLQHGDYFSHAYFARYMGYRLVEGLDLQVVNNDVFIKTLNGLRPVDAIIRCIDGELSDPLELNPNGFLGPLGFVQAVRKKPSMVLNALGSGIIENRGLGSHMTKLCRAILNEDLLLHDAERLWLGDNQARRQVLDNLNEYMIRPVREGTGRPGVAETGRRLVNLMSEDQKKLLEEIQLKGDQLIAEKPRGYATSPTWTEQGLIPQAYAMRLFAVRDGNDYRLLPGGLAMTVNPEISLALNAPEGMARDIWVPETENVAPYKSLLTPHINIKDIDRNSGELPSRIADNLFWLGRYTERAEWTMRLMRSALIQSEEERGLAPDVDAIRKTLEILITTEGSSIPLPSEEIGSRQIDALIRILRSSNVGTFGLKGILENMLYVARLIRDKLSLEAWQALHNFKDNPRWWEDVIPLRTDDSVDLLNEGIRTLAAFTGIMTENMTRNYGWRFLEIGRRLERALNHCQVLHNLFVSQCDDQNEASRLFFILKLADSLITYRSRYRFAPDLPLVLDLLIIDENNPRALCFQLSEIYEHINALPKSADDAIRTEEQKIILDLLTQARLIDIEKIIQLDEKGKRPLLERLLQEQIRNLPLLSEVLSRRYFSLIDNKPTRLHTP